MGKYIGWIIGAVAVVAAFLAWKNGVFAGLLGRATGNPTTTIVNPSPSSPPVGTKPATSTNDVKVAGIGAATSIINTAIGAYGASTKKDAEQSTKERAATSTNALPG